MVPQMEAEITELGRYYGTLQRGDAADAGRRGAAQAAGLMATAATTRPAAAGHRARLTGGLAAAIAEKGYAAVTIADVVRLRARVQAHVLRALRRQGGVLPRALRRDERRAAGADRGRPRRAPAARGTSGSTPRRARTSSASPASRS